MRTRRFPVVAAFILIILVGFVPMASAALPTQTDRTDALGLTAHLEFWLLGAIERVEALFDFQIQPPPPPSVQSDCRSAIDPNGGSCAN